MFNYEAKGTVDVFLRDPQFLEHDMSDSQRTYFYLNGGSLEITKTVPLNEEWLKITETVPLNLGWIWGWREDPRIRIPGSLDEERIQGSKRSKVTFRDSNIV